MDNILGVKISEAWEELMHDWSYALLRKNDSFLFDGIIERPTFDITRVKGILLCNQNGGMIFLEILVDFENVRVVDLLENYDFVLYSQSIFDAVNFNSFGNLQISSLTMNYFINLSLGSYSQQ